MSFRTHICAIVALALPISGAAEAKTVKLTAVGAPPPLVANVKLTKEFFIPEVNKRLAASGQDFSIEWREAYGESLAKFTEVFEAIEEGIGHLGVQIPPFEASKLPLEQYTPQIPFGTTDPLTVTRIDAEIRAKVPEMNKAWTDHNQVYFGGAAADSWHIVTKFPIRTIEDLKGKKIASGGPQGEWALGSGAVQVTAALGSAAVDIKNGVYDGALATLSLAFPFRVFEAAPYITLIDFGSTIPTGLSVNADTWKQLPEHAKKIFTDVAKEWNVRYAQLTLQQAAMFKGLMEKGGAKYVTLEPAERNRWANMLPNMPKRWAAALDSRGLPGSKVIGIYMEASRAAGTKFVRDWDKE